MFHFKLSAMFPSVDSVGLKNKLDEFKCDAFDYRIENSDAGLRGHRARPSGRKGRAPWARCTALGLRHRARAGPFTPTLSLRPAPTPVRQAGRPGLPSRNDIAGPGGGGGGGWMGRSAAADGLRRSAEEVHRAPAAAEQQQAVRTRAPAHAAGTPGRSGLDGTGPSRAGSAAGTGKRARSLSTNHGSTTAVVDPLPGLAPSRLGEGMTRKTLARSCPVQRPDGPTARLPACHTRVRFRQTHPCKFAPSPAPLPTDGPTRTSSPETHLRAAPR